MIGDDEEDDIHFCLKCTSTIIGLDNYVTHRKSGCGKNLPESDRSKSPLPSQLLPSDEIGLNADDFFSSLELRSSSKKYEQSTTGKSFTGILTRSRTTAVLQATTSNKDHFATESKSENNVWIGGNQLKDLGTGDNQSKLIKAVANLERRKESGTTQLSSSQIDNTVYETFDDEFDDDYNYEDDESSDEDYAPPRTGGKWKPGSPFQWLEPQSTAKWRRSFSPPLGYTKGKWKPLEDDNQTTGGGKCIVSGYGKGKGKTDFDCPSISHHPKGKLKIAIKSEEENLDEAHTKGGKWKPLGYDEAESLFAQLKDNEDDIPPPTHTQGKWKPGGGDTNIAQSSSAHCRADTNDNNTTMISKKRENVACLKTGRRKKNSNKSKRCMQMKKVKQTENKLENRKSIAETKYLDEANSNVETHYWCSPCNRNLTSKIVYERHLKSNFHLKRYREDRDFDEDITNVPLAKRMKTEQPEDRSELMVKEVPETNQKLRKRKKVYERCLVCNTKVHKQIIGKHLISHYHCRKGNISTAIAKNMVLDNIESIVAECPFQCLLCKFYCNTHESFINHWKSSMHIHNDSSYTGYYFCLFCKNKCDHSAAMLLHLSSAEHLEVVLVINRSVPITIKKIKEFACVDCKKTFNLNIQLMQHCKKLQHDSSNVDLFTGKVYKCEICEKVFNNPMAMQRHKKLRHNDVYYFCNICDLKFKSLEEARSHRLSLSHKYMSMKRNRPEKKLERKCEHCEMKFSNHLLLKNHLEQEHPEHKIKCPHCGLDFIIAQDLAYHIRSKSCRFLIDPDAYQDDAYQCEICPYTTNVTSEFLFHMALHSDPITTTTSESCDNSKSTKDVKKYKCPLCDQLFSRYSLQAHIRVHMQERPYVCKICNASFARKNNLRYHQKKHEKTTGSAPLKQNSLQEPKLFLCSVCGASFGKQFTLQQHMQIHNGKLFKCLEMGCFYEGRKISELQEHLKVHSDERNYSCHLCSYKGKSRKHLKRHQSIHDEVKKYRCSVCQYAAKGTTNLKRHMVLHTGNKPYMCPHCDYKCNILENLRKHILATTRHPGKTIYSCSFCSSSDPASPFGTNFARDFKNHLLLNHKDRFANGKDASTYIANIFSDVPIDSAAKEQNTGKPDSIIKVKTIDDPIVTQPTPNKDGATLDQMLPMFIIPKEDTITTVDLVSDSSWNIIGQYDVEEESGNLVPFHNDDDENDELFQEHF